MNNFKIREAKIDDVEDICKLEEQYTIDMYTIDSIKSTFQQDYFHTFVGIKDNKIIGYVSATFIFEECNLIKIIVDKNFRHQGYGELLVNFLIHQCKKNGVNKIFLEVRNDNIIAKSFYSKIGFEKESVRKRYYHDGVDAEIFWYYIND